MTLPGVAASRLPPLLGALGLALLAAALGWWWAVFDRVVANSFMTYAQAMPCFVRTSDTCSLAMALCTAKVTHWLGLVRYSPGLFWSGLFVSAAALLSAVLPRRAA